MKKISAVICIVFLSLLFVNTAFAQKNANAYFMIDTDLATAEYQGMSEVLEIGGKAKVGFALYAKQWENAKGFTVSFEWDKAKAEFRAGDSSSEMLDDDETINGAEITYAEEANILASTLIEAGKVDEEGYFTNSYAQQGGDASTAAEGLIYLAVFRTVDAFQVSDALTIKASLSVADEDGNTRFLGTRFFHVNMSVDVKNATWKEVKEQFKDF